MRLTIHLDLPREHRMVKDGTPLTISSPDGWEVVATVAEPAWEHIPTPEGYGPTYYGAISHKAPLPTEESLKAHLPSQAGQWCSRCYHSLPSDTPCPDDAPTDTPERG